jgi:hypothetical protein
MAVTEPVHLITGWEPEVPVTDTLLRQFVHALADSLAGPIQALGGRVARSDALVAADLGRPAAYYNGATLLRPPDPGGWSPIIDEVERLLLAGPVTGDVYLWSPWVTPDLRRRGWVLEGHPPLLFRPRAVRCRPPPLGLRCGLSATRRRLPSGSASWSRATRLATWPRGARGYSSTSGCWTRRCACGWAVLAVGRSVRRPPTWRTDSTCSRSGWCFRGPAVVGTGQRCLGRGSPSIPGCPPGPCSAT